MIDLDDVAALRAADPGGMLDVVCALPEHARLAYGVGTRVEHLPSVDGVSSVVYCGMGGSAVAGDLARALFRDRLGIPFDVVRSPVLPAYVSPHTLVVCSSYSGNTAETLACFGEAIERGARTIAMTSGGALGERCAELGLAVVPVPPGFPPRAALGHLAFGLLGAMRATELVPAQLDADAQEAVRVLDALIARLRPEVAARSNPAKQLATAMRGRIPVVWGAGGIGAVAAARWKTQYNENAKMPAFAAEMPELDHNEVVGWAEGEGRPFFLVMLRTAEERADVAARFPLSREIAEESGVVAEQIEAVGTSPLAQVFSLIATGDLVSIYLALLRGHDPTPIVAIDRLKRALEGT